MKVLVALLCVVCLVGAMSASLVSATANPATNNPGVSINNDPRPILPPPTRK